MKDCRIVGIVAAICGLARLVLSGRPDGTEYSPQLEIPEHLEKPYEPKSTLYRIEIGPQIFGVLIERDGPLSLGAVRRGIGRIVLLLLLIPTLVSADGNQAESGSGDEGERPGWAQRLYDYSGPPEYKVFEVAGHRFRVPYDYLTASSDQERGVFQIAPHWPTLDSPRTDKPQPRHREDFDTLPVTVSRFEDFERRVELIDSRIARVEKAMRRPGQKVERIHGLMRIKDSSILVSSQDLRIWNVRQPVQIICGLGECGIGYMPIAGIEVHIQFDQAILPNWRKLIRRINQLLKNYKVE